MPTYEYKCLNCNKKFALKLSVKEHDTKKAKCLKCDSKKVEQVLGSFFAKTGKKS
jgi:putative FmdB family regulatory protein